MAMNGSGPISLAGTTAGQSIQIENGGNGTTQISLNDAAVRSLAGVPSGAIIMPTNFYGKSNQFTYTVSANQTNFCMRAGAVSAGWNETSALAVNINSGVTISSNSTGTPAMRIQGSYPGGVTVTNSGTIVGMGGNGGKGCWNQVGGRNQPGAAGGTALKVCSPVTFNNTPGTIAGGGGGGGGGGAGNYIDSCSGAQNPLGGGGGGGGRSSNAANSSGGNASYGPATSGSPGGAGTYASAGGGGGGYSFGGVGGGPGGPGGNWGATGSPSCGGSGGGCYATGGMPGGAGGKATCGAGTYITFTGTGTRFGSIS
jgi:hypothetical protein